VKVASLFTGIGGIDLGLEKAGHEITFQCEIIPYRQRVLARHWPGVPFANDIRGTSIPTVDLVCGGFPCQDISAAGRRAGLDGEQSKLFFEFARIAGESVKDGGWVLIENVSNLLNSNEGRDFGVILNTLADLGFHDLAWRVLNSEHFGVPQRRRRVYLVARRADGDRARKVLLEPEGSVGDHRESGEAWQKRTAATGSEPEEAGRVTTQTLTTRFGSTGIDLRDAEANFIVRSFDYRQSAVSLTENRAPTLTTKEGVSIMSGDVLRRLTPTECERLQGFPDGWTLTDGPSLRWTPAWYEIENPDLTPLDPKPDGPRYAAAGDSVTVPVIEWIGRRLRQFGE